MDAAHGDDDEDAIHIRQAQREVARATPDTAKVCLVVLTMLAVLAALSAAATIVLPLLLALVLNLLLAPAKRLLTRLHLPGTAAALVLITVLFALLVGVGAAISVPASQWVARAPAGVVKLQQELGALRKPIAFLRKAFDQVHHALDQGGQPAEKGVQKVAVQQSSDMGDFGLSVLQGTQAAVGQALMVAVLLFFLLAGGLPFAPPGGDRPRLRRQAPRGGGCHRDREQHLGISVHHHRHEPAGGCGQWPADVGPGTAGRAAVGTAAFLLNYIPILGPLTGVMLFFFVGLFSTDGIWWALLPPAIYLAIHVAEGEVITPMLLARRFTLNPVLVIVSLFFFHWLWGVTGALLPVPLLSILKIVCDAVPALTPLGHMLGGPPESRGGEVAAE